MSALVLMTILISYLSLVLGELVPKCIAMQKARRVSLITAPSLRIFARLMRPVIWLVDTSSGLLLRLLGHAPPLRHRRLPAELTVVEASRDIMDRPYSRYPVYGRSIDGIIGFVHVRDLLEQGASGNGEVPIGDIVRPIAQFPGSISLPEAMTRMRASGQRIAMVVDEYGADGMLTLEDLLEELVGEIWNEYDTDQRRAFMRLHESRFLAGAMNLEDFAEATGITLPDGPCETVAGWLLTRLGRLGRAGDVVAIPPEFTADPADDAGAGGETGASCGLEMPRSQATASSPWNCGNPDPPALRRTPGRSLPRNVNGHVRTPDDFHGLRPDAVRGSGHGHRRSHRGGEA